MTATTAPNTPVQQTSGFNGRRLWRAVKPVLFWMVILLILFYTLFPFYWAFNTSLKNENEVIATATLFARNPSLENYQQVLSNQRFIRGLFNSTLVAGGSTLVALVIGSFAAYALGRLQFRGRTIMLYSVLAMTMFPQISILSGLFSIVRDLGLFGSLGSLIITYPLITLPFTVWTLTTFFKGLPHELEQAALVDGATGFQTFYMILLPLTAPALVTTGLLSFISAWNEYLFALTFTAINPSAQTVPVAIALFTGEAQRQEPVPQIMAASVLVTLPLIALVLYFQRRIVEGLTAGAVKG